MEKVSIGHVLRDTCNRRLTGLTSSVRYVPRAAGPDAAARDGIGIRDGTGAQKRTKTEERTYCQGITLGPRESQS